MEDKTSKTSGEDVKDTTGKGDWTWGSDNSTDIEKLKELDKNKTIALKQEREEKQALAEKLAQYEKKEKEEQEKEQKKKWQYEELLSAKDKTIQELSEKATAYDTLMASITEKETNQLNDLMTKVPKETLEKNSFILEDLKSNEKKIKFLETLIPKIEDKKEDFDNKSKGKNPWEVDRLEVLKEKSKTWKMTPWERWELLNLTRAKFSK